MPADNRARDFRYVYANSFGLGLAGNEMTIRFAIIEDPTKPAESQQEQVAVVTTLTGAKTIALMIMQAIQSYEIDTHTEVPTPNMQAIFATAHKSTATKP
jgi:hypothetical protein